MVADRDGRGLPAAQVDGLEAVRGRLRILEPFWFVGFSLG